MDPNRITPGALVSAVEYSRMLPLSDGLKARNFPFVNISLIVANFAVWLFYELPHLNSSVFHASFYPCTVNSSCRARSRGGSAGSRRCSCTGAGTTSSGTCCSWRSSGRTSRTRSGTLRYLVFYFAGGFVATMTQTLMTLRSAPRRCARPQSRCEWRDRSRARRLLHALSRSRACSASPSSSRSRSPPGVFLGFWFLYQLFEANYGLYTSTANGGGVAFFAHVGGFVFGLLVAKLLLDRRTDTATGLRLGRHLGTRLTTPKGRDIVDDRQIHNSIDGMVSEEHQLWERPN